jgi:NO-binding membrane sensor protein with MHYT domain
VVSSAVLLGAGVASMHYVGIHGLAGHFAIVHDTPMILLSILIAVVTAYGGLRAFLARQDGIRLIVSSIAFGVAVAGMHYTAMDGMHFVPLADGSHHHIGGLAASQQILSVVVALLCFVIAAGFLLSLVPDPRRQATAAATIDPVAGTAADVGAARRPRPAAARRPGAPASGRRRQRHPFHQ